VPLGYTLRHVAGEAEAEALVRLQRAAFASNTMTAAWRRRAMDAPEYVPELDIVAEEPGGQLAGFCWCWLSPGTHRSQIEPIGVHPQHARPGLARAMLLESLWRLQAHGAHEVCAAAYEDDEAAARLYQGAGFHLDFRTTAYARTFD
jgi:mycothiol synthase